MRCTLLSLSQGSQGFKAMQDGKRKLRGQGLGIGGKWQNKGFLVDALGADVRRTTACFSRLPLAPRQR